TNASFQHVSVNSTGTGNGLTLPSCTKVNFDDVEVDIVGAVGSTINGISATNVLDVFFKRIKINVGDGGTTNGVLFSGVSTNVNFQEIQISGATNSVIFSGVST